jgi:hypothetical protein
MAVTETRTLPAPFIEELGKDYAKQITALTAQPIDVTQFAPQVAAQDPLQTKAAELAQSGIGSFQPFITEAQRLGGVDPSTGQVTAAGVTAAQQPFMSPYQQDVIDVTLSEFDRQRQIQEQAIRDQAVAAGAFGGGREGVQLAEFGTGSARERALLQAGLQQQGFQQAQQAAARAQQQQLGLATLLPGLEREQIGTLGQVGSIQQAQEQAQLEAQQQAARAQAMEPYERLGFYGSGITGLMGGYPAQYQFSSTPSASPLQTALGIGSTIAGLYGGLRK